MTALYPEFIARAWEMKGCAELVSHGEKLDAICAKIAERTAATGGFRMKRHGYLNH